MRVGAAALCLAIASLAQDPTTPFVPDPHTLLLYHLDEAQGDEIRDASGHGQHGLRQGAGWSPKGRFGGALWFDGKDDTVFVAQPEALRGLRQITVECWFKPEAAAGRRFLVGHDVGFHFEVDDAVALSMSLYNQGGAVPNAEGKPHQQVAMGGVQVRTERWHHLAITYDGGTVSYLLDGVLRGRLPGPRSFALGAASRGLWLGCYIGMDYWYSGLMDEVRVSDCVRYDPEGRLQPGGKVFAMPSLASPLRPPPAVRPPVKKGAALLTLGLRKRHGGEAKGWVCLKPPDAPAAIVGEYALTGDPGQTAALSLDVSDEFGGDGSYLLGLVPATAGYYALTAATLNAGGREVCSWTGEVNSRWTFRPPLLLALTVGPSPPAPPGASLLVPGSTDWSTGTLELDRGEEGQPPLLTGDGAAEWWLHVPVRSTWRVHLRYASSVPRPCDLVIDGDDLNAYDLCAMNVSPRASAVEALWEYQGSIALEPGAHWLRLQDALPDLAGVWLEPVAVTPPAKVPWQRFPVPSTETVRQAGPWTARAVFGKATGDAAGTRFSAEFANTDPNQLFAGDRVRFTCPVQWDLEPFGRLRFGFTGSGSGHVAMLKVVDAKGDEKLLWRQRDQGTEPLTVSLPLSFEGNDVFDPGHGVALCLDLDEGNVRATETNRWTVALTGLELDARAALAAPAPAQARTEAVQAARLYARRAGGSGSAVKSPGYRPWAKPVTPEWHPLFATTEPKPVTRATLGPDLQFTGARDIGENALRDFHVYYGFGEVCWPHIGILPQRREVASDDDYQKALRNLEERLQDVQRRHLFLFDIWGYVPNNEAGPTPRVAPEHHEILLRVMGDRFLGYDNGEQDGRYIGAYADRGTFSDRRGGWEDFQRWDEKICGDSMGYMNATGSLNFSHYYAERGARTLGLETAQGLPSDTLMFAFLRGAAKQYGRLTTQATSIWNRFGYNMYHDRRTDGPNGYGLGPRKGCSLSLHRRLFFQSYTGGDSIVGTETSQFTGDRLENGAPELSPLGAQHLAIERWVVRHPERGVLYTPVAFMLDFHNGWNMPRHLYRGDRYRVWGKLPYEKGDHLIDNVFRQVWPGYEDCSYLRNERGFITPTPYGDLFDVLTNRAHPEVLRQYTSIMLLGDVELGPETAAGLGAFVRSGGDLWLDASHAAQLGAGLTGVIPGTGAEATVSARAGTREVWPEEPYTYRAADLRGAQPCLVNEVGQAIQVMYPLGSGRVFTCLVDRWMTDPLTYAAPEIVNMEPPYAILNGLRTVLDDYWASFLPVLVDPPGLNVRVNAYAEDPDRLLVALTNNDLFADWEGTVRLREGSIARAVDLRADTPLPTGRRLSVTVAAGEVVLLEVRRR